MHYLSFIKDDTDMALAISANYDPVLVALSCLIAVIAAYVSLRSCKMCQRTVRTIIMYTCSRCGI